MQILVLSGFLGSGKTSLLMRLAEYLTKEAQKGERLKVVILENESGADGVDDKLLRSGGLQVENLFAGCACCTVGGELIGAVQLIEEEYDPDWIILETTGLAYPGLIQENLKEAAQKECRICTVVDVSRWKRLKKPMEALLTGQIACAETVLLNKADLVSKETLGECRSDIQNMNPNAKICVTSAASGDLESVWASVLGEGEIHE